MEYAYIKVTGEDMGMKVEKTKDLETALQDKNTQFIIVN